jgi:signal transduction histidine kinase
MISNSVPPVPANELDRVTRLSDLDLDYSAYQDNFKDLAKLAAKVAGTEISLVNLIDSYTQWTISNFGFDLEQMPREESVCQYTIMDDGFFEVKDLSADERFKDRDYVKNEPNFRFYYGLPLQTEVGIHIGALCVLDKRERDLSPEKQELLKIIAEEIVNRLKAFKVIDHLKNELAEAKDTQKKVAHDIRGPLAGIIGLAQVISDQGKDNQIDEVLEFINLIQRSGRSILELADEILSYDARKEKNVRLLKEDEFNLVKFKDKLEKLYTPQAKNKQITLAVKINNNVQSTPFSKNKLLQITGNLISNAIKFTPDNGSVQVALDLVKASGQNVLKITVADSGVGMDQNAINVILNGTASSTDGTSGEKGYGFGLALVKHLIETLRGSLQIHSEPGQGTTFAVSLPQRTER